MIVAVEPLFKLASLDKVKPEVTDEPIGTVPRLMVDLPDGVVTLTCAGAAPEPVRRRFAIWVVPPPEGVAVNVMLSAYACVNVGENVAEIVMDEFGSRTAPFFGNPVTENPDGLSCVVAAKVRLVAPLFATFMVKAEDVRPKVSPLKSKFFVDA